MRKPMKSKLDPYAETLLEMEDRHQSGREMLSWLASQGLHCALDTVLHFLRRRRQARLQERLLGRITNGADQCREVEKLLGKNPAPALETLIKLHRVLIFQLSSQVDHSPDFDLDFARLANQLTRTVMDYARGQTEATNKKIELAQAERKLKLTEKKAAAFDQAQQVTTSKLTPEEKEAEYKRIFGLE